VGQQREDRVSQNDSSSDDLVLIERDERVALLTLNRPEKMNALNQELRTALEVALAEVDADTGVKVAVLCGAGEKAFVAGADVTEFAGRTLSEQRAVYDEPRVYDAVAAFSKPLIVAIHGHCVGGGCELALACDIRVADRTARFAQAEIRLGLIPGAGGTQRLARLVGAGQAMRIALSGDAIGGEEAHRIGLVELLADPGEHIDRAVALAHRIARWSPVALRLAKRAVNSALETPLAAGLELERELFLAAFGSEDGREGVQAFVEKRPPVFTGL